MGKIVRTSFMLKHLIGFWVSGLPLPAFLGGRGGASETGEDGQSVETLYIWLESAVYERRCLSRWPKLGRESLSWGDRLYEWQKLCGRGERSFLMGLGWEWKTMRKSFSLWVQKCWVLQERFKGECVTLSSRSSSLSSSSSNLRFHSYSTWTLRLNFPAAACTSWNTHIHKYESNLQKQPHLNTLGPLPHLCCPLLFLDHDGHVFRAVKEFPKEGLYHLSHKLLTVSSHWMIFIRLATSRAVSPFWLAET